MTDTAASMASDRFHLTFAGDGRVGVAILDMDLRYVRVNDALAAMNGVSADAHIGRTIAEVVDGVPDGVLSVFRGVLETGTPLESLAVQDEKPDDRGRLRQFSESAYRLEGADGRPVGLVAIVVEMTPEQEALRAAEQAREQLMNERERLLAVLASMPSGVAVADAATGEMVLANALFEEIAGDRFPSGQHLSEMGARGFRPDGTAYEPEDWPLARSMQTGEVVAAEEISLERPDGSSVVVEASSVPTRDANGTITGGIVVMHDVTDRRRDDLERETLLRQLAEERVLLLEVLARMQTGVLVTLPDDVVLTNEAFGAAWRHPVEAVMRRDDLSDFIGLDGDGNHLAIEAWPDGRALATGAVIAPEDISIVRGDGSAGVIEAAAAPIRNAAGEIVGSVTVVQDVTEQRAAAAQERRLLELAASLAAAHTAAEVEDVSLEWLVRATGCVRAGLALVLEQDGRRFVRRLHRRTPEGEDDEQIRERSDRRESPAERAALMGTVLTYPSTAAMLKSFPELADLVRPDGEARAFVPLPGARESLGAATLTFGEIRAISEGEQRFLRLAGERIGAALERAKASDAVGEAERRSRLVQSLATGLSRAASTEEAARETLRAAVDATSADVGLLAVVDESERMLQVVASTGFAAGASWPSAERIDLDAAFAMCEAFRLGQPVDVPDRDVWRSRYPAGFETLGALGRSQYSLPIVAQGRSVGVIGLIFDEDRGMTRGERELAGAFAAQAALALDRTRRYDAEHQAVVAFQRAMLPSHLEPAPGVSLTARYVPSSSHLEVGGDWYDVTTLPNGRLALVVGDVVGKGVEAAAVMGQLRTAWRSLVTRADGPDVMLRELERFADGVPGAWCSTLLCAELDPWSRRLRFTSAGHPPPLVLESAGARFLEGGRSVPLLADPGAPRTAAAYELAPGATIVLYTDGLIERRTRPLDDGLAALRAAVNAAPHDNVERLADLVLGAMTADGGSADDAALLCVRLQPPFSAELTADPVALRSVRADVATWLRAGGVPEPVADDVVLAVHEATANAVEHAYAEAEPDGVSVSLWRDADGAVRAEIRDRGRWRTGGSEPTRGRGLPLMSALMDDVAVRHEADGTTVTMGLRPQNEEDR